MSIYKRALMWVAEVLLRSGLAGIFLEELTHTNNEDAQIVRCVQLLENIDAGNLWLALAD
jgi:hypothetical protein